MGYINKESITGGQLISASFLNPGKETFRVSDIKVDGYQTDVGFYESGDFGCDFYVLDNGGRTIKGKDLYFSYADVWDWDAYAFLGGKWSNYGVEIVPGSDDDYELKAGQAVWLQMPPNDGEHTFTFCSAGEVIQAEIPFPMITGGNGISNPMATDVWVSDLAISGYDTDVGFYESGDFGCDFYVLDNGGRTIKGKDIYFSYADVWDWDAYAFLGGKWSNFGVEIVPHGEGDFKLAPGQGVWLQCPPNDGEHTFVLTFPQVVGEQAAK